MANGQVETAYTGAAAHDYDSRRFSTPQGRAFHHMEAEQVLGAARDLAPGARVLEVGCGTGRFLEELGGRGLRLTGLDPSPDMLEVTGGRLAKANVEAELASGEGAALPFADDTFDLVYAVRVLNQTATELYAWRVVDEMIRVARPGGRILLEFANRWRPSARNRSVRLSLGALEQHVAARGDVEVIDRTGLAVFSQTLFERTPTPFLPAWSAVERRVARRFPELGSRCYALLSKGGAERSS